MITQDQLKEVQTRVEQLNHYLNIPAKKIQYEEEQLRTQAPEFWEDQKRAEEQMKVVKGLEKWIKDYQEVSTLADELATAFDFYKEELVTEQEVDELYARTITSIEELELKNMLRKEEDSMDAVLKINSGAGGTEAQDWAQMLYRMYTRWAERRGFAVSTIDFLEGDEAGIKSVTFQVSGLNAYGYAKCEKGVHRLVRISPFDAAGRRHTSFASLEVMPEIEEDTTVVVNPDDLKVDTYRASGAGGQHINKTDSAIRITHLPTGVVVSCQNERSQHKNREMAMKMLKAKLAEIMEREQKEKIEDIKGEQKDVAWGSQIRSYVFHPYNLVKDHRTGFEMGNIGAVMDGDIDGYINEYLKQKATDKI